MTSVYVCVCVVEKEEYGGRGGSMCRLYWRLFQ